MLYSVRSKETKNYFPFSEKVTRNETAMRTKMQTTKTITKTRGSVTCCHLNVILESFDIYTYTCKDKGSSK